MFGIFTIKFHGEMYWKSTFQMAFSVCETIHGVYILFIQNVYFWPQRELQMLCGCFMFFCWCMCVFVQRTWFVRLML